MSTMITELYKALIEAGATDDKAQAAAEAVSAYQNDVKGLYSQLAEMRAELRADMADAKAEIIKWTVGAIMTACGLTLAIVKLMQ